MRIRLLAAAFSAAMVAIVFLSLPGGNPGTCASDDDCVYKRVGCCQAVAFNWRDPMAFDAFDPVPGCEAMCSEFEARCSRGRCQVVSHPWRQGYSEYTRKNGAKLSKSQSWCQKDTDCSGIRFLDKEGACQGGALRKAFLNNQRKNPAPLRAAVDAFQNCPSPKTQCVDERCSVEPSGSRAPSKDPR